MDVTTGVALARVLAARGSHGGGGVEAIGVDLALHDVGFTPLPDHAIHFAARLVAPVPRAPVVGQGPELIEDEVLLQRTTVLVPNLLPPADEADEPGIEPVRLWP